MPYHVEGTSYAPEAHQEQREACGDHKIAAHGSNGGHDYERVPDMPSLVITKYHSQ